MTQTQPSAQQQQQAPQQASQLTQPQSSVPTGQNPELKYIDLDFSPGIFDDQFGNLRSAPDGAATPNTYGCFSPPAGGLAPLPRASADAMDQWTLTPTQINDGGAVVRPTNLPNSNDGNRGYGRMFLLDAVVHGPVAASSSNHGAFSYANDALFAQYAYNYSPTGIGGATGLGSYKYYGAFVHRIPNETTHSDLRDLAGVSFASRALVIGAGNMAVTTAKNTGPITYRPTVIALFAVGTVNSAVFYWAFPNPTAPSNTIGYGDDLSGATHVYAAGLLAHQGRALFIAADRENWDMSSEGTTYIPEQLYFGAYGKFDLSDTNLTGPSVVVEENPSGISAWGSINANELILIKNSGGGVEISGALENPQVLRLPGLRSTGGLPSMAVNVPGKSFRYPGLVYGTSQGVFMWAGVDNSEAISESLDPLFWLWNRNWSEARFGNEVITATSTPLPGMLGPLGRFGYIHPYLFAPNGYVCDFRSSAWWQIESPATNVHYTHWHISSRPHRIWGFKGYIDDNENLAAQCFDLNEGRTSYYYESHPLRPSRNRFINCREILATVVGKSGDTVAFTLVGLDNGSGSTQKTVTYTFTATGMKMLRLDTNMVAAQVQLWVTSTSNNSEDAPRVLDTSIGYIPQSMY